MRGLSLPMGASKRLYVRVPALLRPVSLTDSICISIDLIKSIHNLSRFTKCLIQAPCRWLRECCRQAEAEVVSNSRNRFCQTTYEDFFSALYMVSKKLFLLPLIKLGYTWTPALAKHLGHICKCGDSTTEWRRELSQLTSRH